MNLLAGRGETKSGFPFAVGWFEDIQQNELPSQRHNTLRHRGEVRDQHNRWAWKVRPKSRVSRPGFSETSGSLSVQILVIT